VSFDARLLKKLEIIDGSAKICLTDALDLEADGVFAGIEHAVLAGAIVLELKHYVAVIERIDVFGFALIELFHGSISFC
jgi:hypothetical protein